MYKSGIKQSSPLLARLKTLTILLLLIGLVIFLVYQVYLFLNRTQVEKYFSDNQTFGILLLGQSGQGKKVNTRFITVATIVPERSRIGFVSLFPEVRLKENEATIGERASFASPEDLASDLESLFNINIPFHMVVKPDDVARLIDLIEGLDYFIYGPQAVPGENLPRGEFVLDGALAKRLLLTKKTEADLIAPHLLYRYYSFMLNLWQNRVNKWALLKEETIFSKAATAIKSDLRVSEMYSLAKRFFANDNWLPLFMEVPLQRSKDKYFLDAEATQVLVKDFKKTLAAESHPYIDRPPKIEVKNGTDRPGLARKFGRRLGRKGLRVLEFSNADREDYNESVLLGISANSYFLQTVAKLIKPRKVYHAVNKAIFTDLMLVVGRDHKILRTDN